MIIKADSHSYFVFDLDDTLYLEKDYLKSAYYAICTNIVPQNAQNLFDEMLSIHFSGGNAFEFLIEKYPTLNLSLEKLLYLYRNHYPKIALREGVLDMLLEIKSRGSKIGIITDGREITQTNKINALGLDKLVDKLVISEKFGASKPVSALYESFMQPDHNKHFFYFGDNIQKDFISPKKLGWTCIGILDPENIHKLNVTDISNEYMPHVFIDNFAEIGII
jgi:putative hydrolase of the HAD superfamily